MRKFKFRLESVLQFRKQEEESAKNLYLEAQSRRFEVENQISEIEHVRAENLRQGADDLKSRLALQGWVDNLDNQQHQFHVALEILQQEEDMARGIWIERKRESEALEKMRAKELDAHNFTVALHEQNELDEWATMRKKSA